MNFQPQTPIQSQSIQPVINQSSENNKYLYAIILMLTILILIGVGYIIFLSQNKPQIITTSKLVQPTLQVPPGQAPSTTQVVQPSSQPDEFAEWKDEINQESNYSFKYPATWQKKNDAYISENKEKLKIYFQQGNEVGIGGPCVQIIKQNEPITIAGISATKSINTWDTDIDHPSCPIIPDDNNININITFSKNNIYYAIDYWYNSQNETKAINTFNQILSTFKFFN